VKKGQNSRLNQRNKEKNGSIKTPKKKHKVRLEVQEKWGQGQNYKNRPQKRVEKKKPWKLEKGLAPNRPRIEKIKKEKVHEKVCNPRASATESIGTDSGPRALSTQGTRERRGKKTRLFSNEEK